TLLLWSVPRFQICQFIQGRHELFCLGFFAMPSCLGYFTVEFRLRKRLVLLRGCQSQIVSAQFFLVLQCSFLISRRFCLDFCLFFNGYFLRQERNLVVFVRCL